MITFWRRLPIIVRSAVLGILVILLSLPWSILAGINFKFLSHIPWSVAVMAIYMLACWQYLNGKWWPRSTRDSRRQSLRANRVSAKAWQWCIVAFTLGWLSLKAFEFAFDRVFKIPQEAFPNVSTFSSLTIIAYILMVAIVAGVYEEAGLRGYMQGPIERRYGPWVAYLAVGITFWIAHITNYIGHMGLFLASSWYFVAASVLLGALAYLTNSILPGVVLHASADAVSGLIWWLQSTRTELAGTNHPLMLILAIAVVVVLAPADVWAFRKLASVIRTGR